MHYPVFDGPLSLGKVILSFFMEECTMLHFRKQGAFTLIELLIVVAIIAILAAIAVPNFLEAQTRAKVSRAKSDMRTLATALESYYVDNNNYVPSSTVSDTDGANSAFLNTPTSVDPLVEDIVNQWITNNTVIKYPGVWKTYHLKSNCLLSGDRKSVV
jgi:prepilin-type N-terminal cleavage/methylation domain-containing protein